MLNEVAHLSGSELARLMSEQPSASGQTDPGEFMKEAAGAAAHFTCSACRGEANAPRTHQARVVMEKHFFDCAGCIFMQQDKKFTFLILCVPLCLEASRDPSMCRVCV